MTVGPKPGKPAWPLYLVAALAYIPLLGFFLGSVAVTWGLVSSRPHARRAAVIAATGALLNVLLVVLAIVVPGPGRVAFQQENRNAVEESLGEILAALEAHHAATHAYPASLKALQRARGPLHALPIYDFSAGVLRFRPFQYVVSD
ncbi:MAG TPA: hypothetical protein VFU23_08860, partial [Gemmatimonadales bacterium]|nr:hypothetical protein [Gemmatimonadales bacterium]